MKPTFKCYSCLAVIFGISEQKAHHSHYVDRCYVVMICMWQTTGIPDPLLPRVLKREGHTATCTFLPSLVGGSPELEAGTK